MSAPDDHPATRSTASGGAGDGPLVAFLGLGRMGRRMAGNVVRAGFPLVAYNRSPGPREELAKLAGVRTAATPAAAAAEADIVVTMLADGDALLDVVTGSDGVVTTLRDGATVIDMGTSGPGATARAREAVEGVGAGLIDAPVSGSTPAAQDATLLIMVGGDEAAFRQVEPVLSAIGRPVLVGPPGAGATLKLAVNSILYALNQALAESVTVAESAGVAPTTVLDIVADSAAGAPMVGYRRPQYLDPTSAPVTFTLDLAAKDLRLVLEQARGAEIAMPQAERTLETVLRLIEEGAGGQDMGYVVEGARRRAAGRAVVDPDGRG